MKSIMKFTTQAGSYLSFFVALAAFAFPAQAHEFRDFGRYNIGIGADGEPPQVGVANGIDVFAAFDLDPGPGENFVQLDRTKGDIVNISVVPITVKTETNSAPVVEAEHLFTNFQQTVIEGSVGYLATGFTPDRDDVGGTGPGTGYLGFYLTAYVKKVGQPGKTLILKKYVCGAGSLDTVFGTEFACVIP